MAKVQSRTLDEAFVGIQEAARATTENLRAVTTQISAQERTQQREFSKVYGPNTNQRAQYRDQGVGKVRKQ